MHAGPEGKYGHAHYTATAHFLLTDICLILFTCSAGNLGRQSVGGIATRYRLDVQGIEIWWGPGAHPASYTMGTGSLHEGGGG
jgi:hypothetical protein